MQFCWFVKQHNCAHWGFCRSHTINRQYKTRTDAASAIQWALTTWNYSLCSWKVAFYFWAPGNSNKGHWFSYKEAVAKRKQSRSIKTDLSLLNFLPIKYKIIMQMRKLIGERNIRCKVIHVETEACDASVFGLSKNHTVSEKRILWCAELWVHACGLVLSSLSSCETGCRWKKSQVLRGDINHWWTDTSEKKYRETEGKPGQSRQQTQSYSVTFWPCWELGESSLSGPAQPIPAHMNTAIPEGSKRIWCNAWQGVTINTLIFQEPLSYTACNFISSYVLPEFIYLLFC